MDAALVTIAAGLRAQMETVELIGNNIANAGTTGYKADDEFLRLFLAAPAEADPNSGELGWMPVVEGSRIDFRQGPLIETEAVLDIALEGTGFLAVEGPSGRMYTRDGSLVVSPGGRLETRDGLAVLDPEGRVINLPPNGPIEIAKDGAISVGGIAAGRLGLFEFTGAPPLAKAGSNSFVPQPGRTPDPAAGTAVRQGRLEGSNVNVPEAAVRLMLATRGFEMMRRVASLVGDEMDGRAVQQLGRTS